MSFSRSISRDIRKQDRLVGLFLILAMAIVIYLLFINFVFHANKRNWIELHAVLPESYGLTAGTLIELSGVTVGNIESVELQADASVAIELVIDNEFEQHLRTDSQLSIGSQVGLDTVLGGASMKLIPGSAAQLLSSGDTVKIVAPKSMGQYMEDLRLDELMAQAQSIVSSVDTLLAGLAGSSDDISGILASTSGLMIELTETSKQLPELLATSDKMLTSLDATLRQVETSQQQLLLPLEQILTSSNQTLLTLDNVLAETQPSLAKLPNLLESLDGAAISADRLTRQLSNHWLLGGNGQEMPVGGAGYDALPADETLYKQ